MKKMLLALFATFLFVAPVQAANKFITDTHKDPIVSAGLYYLSKAPQQGAWLQGMVTTKDTIYTWDGSQLNKGVDGVNTNLFELEDMRLQLMPYKLDLNTSYYSFMMSAMELKGNDIYVSGLIFRDAQKDRLKSKGKDVVGQSYTILFKVSPSGKGTLLHVSLSKSHVGIRTGGIWDNATGMPNGAPSPYESELFNPIVHFQNVTPAKFSFSGNNVILTRHRENINTGQEWADIIEVTAPFKATRLHSFNVNKNRTTYHYVYGVRNKNILTVYDELGVATRNLTTKKVTYEKLSDKPFLTRPQQRGGKMFFLNDTGFMNLYKDAKGKYHAKYLIRPEKISGKPHIEITHYDWNIARGGVLYLSDWLRPRYFWSLDVR